MPHVDMRQPVVLCSVSLLVIASALIPGIVHHGPDMEKTMGTTT